MLQQRQKVKYNGFEATILGFMKDGRICIEVNMDDLQYTAIFVNREDIEC